MTPGPARARGVFVAFEGGEGAGKSTQIELVRRLAEAAGITVVTCREPGGTPFGEAIRAALLHQSASARAELLAFNAARAALVDAVIAPALRDGALVLCDRFAASSVAYQQYGRGLPAELVGAAIGLATGGLRPHLQVLLDLAAAEGLRRAGGGDEAGDRFEGEDLAFHERVREGFHRQAAAEPARWLVLDATRPREALAAAAWGAIEGLLARG